MHTETFYREQPQARAWACVAQDGSPVTYMDYQLWRHFACINNPDYRAYLRRVIDLALAALACHTGGKERVEPLLKPAIAGTAQTRGRVADGRGAGR